MFIFLRKHWNLKEKEVYKLVIYIIVTAGIWPQIAVRKSGGISDICYVSYSFAQRLE